MKYIIKILILSFLMYSCGEHQESIYDHVNGKTLAYFKQNSANLPIAINSTGSVDIVFEATTISSQDRTVQFSIDMDKTNAPTSMYSFSSNTATIPANSYTGIITLNGVYDVLLEHETRILTLNIDGIDGGVVEPDKNLTVSLFQFCPVPDTFFTGMYLIEQTSAYTDGPTLNDGTVVEVTADGTTRSFSTQNYPDYCNAYMDFEFKLLCNEIVIGNQDSVCRCTSATDWFGAPTTNSTYSIDDGDTVIFVTFADDAQGDCNPVLDITYKFTKQ